MIGRSGREGERKLDRVEREGKKEQKIGKGEEAKKEGRHGQGGRDRKTNKQTNTGRQAGRQTHTHIHR